MRKLIALPMPRYNSLVEREKKADRGLNETIKATMKNLENQELLQRRYHYKQANEEIPETLDKPLRQTAYTWLPPPPIDKIRAHKRKQLKPKKIVKKVKTPKLPKKKTVKKAVAPPVSYIPPAAPVKQPFQFKKMDLSNPNNFA